MKINSDLLIDSKVNGTFYANDFKCKNMLNPYTFIRGNISDTGSYQSNTVNYLSDYIEVKPNTQYIASANVAQPFFQISEWTNNKIFIKRTALQNTATNTIKTTATTKYVRISYNKDNNTAMTQEILLGFEPQLEIGDKATSYTPYKSYENIIPTKKWTGIKVNSTYCHTTDFAYQCCIIGNYAFVNIGSVAFKTGNVPNYTTILTGLPPAKQYYVFHLLGGLGTKNNPCIRVGINGEGSLQTHWTEGISYNADYSANTQYTGTFVYEIKK